MKVLKKAISIMLAGVLSAACLAGCGTGTGAVVPDNVVKVDKADKIGEIAESIGIKSMADYTGGVVAEEYTEKKDTSSGDVSYDSSVWDCLVYDDKDTAIADVKSYITYLEGEGYEIVKDSTNVYASDVAELDSGAKDLDFKLQNGKNEIDISYSEQVQWKGNEGKTGVTDLIYYNE